MTKTVLKVLFILLTLTTACRRAEEIVPSTSTDVTSPDDNIQEVKGFYLLNEGNMGNNKCTLDYFDYATGVYTKNIYGERNPGVVKELGDVGNDLQIYRDRLYCVVNCSNFIEVMDVETAKHIGIVSIPNCRYITFKDDSAYVSSYAGPVAVDPNARLGYVAKIDLATLKVVGECTVGYQPDGLEIVGDKLYVANSGGYRKPNYDTRLSVIDLNTFTETKKIEVAINLNLVVLDNYDYLWISSRGSDSDSGKVASTTIVLDTKTDNIVKRFDIANSNMTLAGDLLYVLSSEPNSKEKRYVVIDTKTQEIAETNFIKDGSEKSIVVPYGLAVNPKTSDLFVTDAKDYITPGKLHCYSKEGKLKWSVTTGDIPAHIAFTNTQLLPLK